MNPAIKLRKLERSDFPIMDKWLHNSHIEAFLGDRDEWMAEMKENFDADWISYFIAETDRPVGFMQYYDTSRAPVGIWTQAPQFSLGIDFFVGEELDQGKGYVTRMIGEMKKKLRWEGLCKYMVADPDPTDKAAVRVLEKNGFIMQPNGLYQAEVDH